MKIKEKVMHALAVLCVIMLIAQAMLFLFSWLVAAVKTDASVHSLLSNEGIRWFFGSFVDNISSPLLIWIIFVAMAAGVICDVHFFRDVKNLSVLPYRSKFALQFVSIELISFVVGLIFTALVPHAPLLSVTGELFPSSFSRSFIPMLAFIVIVVGVTYGVLSGKMKSILDIFKSVGHGIGRAAPLILVYIIATELYFSILYVFSVDF